MVPGFNSARLLTHQQLHERSGLSIVHDERDRAAPPLDSTAILDPIPGTWSPGVRCPDFSVIQSNEKNLVYFQSTMCTDFLPGAKVLDKLTVLARL